MRSMTSPFAEDVARFSDFHAEVPPVHVRQHHVQNQQIRLLPAQQRHALGAVCRGEHRVAVLFEIPAQTARDGRCIITNQNASHLFIFSRCLFKITIYRNIILIPFEHYTTPL